MATKQEQKHVLKTDRERTDYDDGWSCGFDSPYPKASEETILANIAKVSPAFVAGYRAAQLEAHYEDFKSQWEQDAAHVEKLLQDLED